jgi:hypothetical protein
LSSTSFTTGRAEGQPDVEGELRQHLADFAHHETVVHGAGKVMGNLRHLARRYQCGDGDQAAITRCKVRPQS